MPTIVGFKHSERTKRKISKKLKGRFMGSKNHNWKGGVRKSYQGYIMVHSLNHPNRNKDNAIKQCHLVMEKTIGRYLKKGELVHHINGIKDDDRPKNLQLFANQKEHYKYGHNNFNGKLNPFYGKHHTEEAKEKNRQAHLKSGNA